jgi:hypothetical protein
MIDWDHEAAIMAFDYVVLCWDHPHSEALGLAEAKCAERLGLS